MAPVVRVLLLCVAMLGSMGIALADNDKPGESKGGAGGHDVAACTNYLPFLRPGLSAGQLDRPANGAPAHGDWSNSEQEVWTNLCMGLPAQASKAVHPASIRGELIRAIVDSNQFDYPGFDRIVIEGYEVTGHLTLSKTKITNFVSLQDCIFKEFVDFSFVATDHNLDLTGSTFEKGLSLRGFKSTQSVLLDPYLYANLGEDYPEPINKPRVTAQFIDLALAHVDGVVAIGNVKTQYVDASGASVGQFFRIYQSQLGSVILLNLSAGSINLLGNTVDRAFMALGSEREPCLGNNVMAGLVVRDSVILDRSRFDCPMDLDAAKIGGNLDLRGTMFKSLDLTGSHIDGDLVGGPAGYNLATDARDSTTETREFKGQLILDHAQVDVLRVPVNRWFDYSATAGATVLHSAECLHPAAEKDLGPPGPATAAPAGGFTEQLSELMSGRPVLGRRDDHGASLISADGFAFRSFGATDFCFKGDLLGDSRASTLPMPVVGQFLFTIDYSPAEFDRVSDMLRSGGQESDGRQVEMWRSELERNHRWESGSLWDKLSAVFMTASGFLVGFGYHVEYSFLYALVFLALGWIIFSRLNLKTGPSNRPADIVGKKDADYTDVSAFSYSFEMLLPIIRLREKHYDIDIIRPWPRRYFYVHKVMGYMLGIYMLAGLAGVAH